MQFYQNEQWAVTDFGIESVKPAPTYLIEASRLTETTDYGRGTYYSWPVHMAEKTWVVMDAFVAAYRQALEIHIGKYAPPVDAALLEASIDEGEARAAPRQRARG